MCTYRDALKAARNLGAVKVGVYYTGSYFNRSPFTAHFFRSDGKEVGFYHYDLGPLSENPLTVLEPPRVWGSEALASVSISEIQESA